MQFSNNMFCFSHFLSQGISSSLYTSIPHVSNSCCFYTSNSVAKSPCLCSNSHSLIPFHPLIFLSFSTIFPTLSEVSTHFDHKRRLENYAPPPNRRPTPERHLGGTLYQLIIRLSPAGEGWQLHLGLIWPLSSHGFHMVSKWLPLVRWWWIPHG